jgi:DNA-binding MarR family transcriptional regulator
VSKRPIRLLLNGIDFQCFSNRKEIMNEELSAVQRKMLVELQTFIAKQGYPPTVGELAEKLKRTKASIHGTLDKLITKGFDQLRTELLNAEVMTKRTEIIPPRILVDVAVSMIRRA